MTYVASGVSLTMDGGPISNPDIGCYLQCCRAPLVIFTFRKSVSSMIKFSEDGND